MSIHRYAERGDIASIQRELAQAVSIDAIDPQADVACDPITPLQCALASPSAGVDTVQFLISQGATLHVTPQTGKSDLQWAVRSGNVEKIQLLLALGADLTYRDSHGYDALIDAMFSHAQGADRLTLVQFLLEQGVALNGESNYGESALSVASRCGSFDIIRVLLDAGGDPSLLGWSALMKAVALGTLPQVEGQLASGADLKAVDRWERTAWLLSLQTGDVAKAQCLLAAGSNPFATGRCGKLPLMYALESGNRSMLTWLLELGLDVNAADEFGQTALMLAVELDQVEVASLLLDAGANAAQANKYHRKAIQQASSTAMIEQLLMAGESLADIDLDMRRCFTQVATPDGWELDPQEYQCHKHRRFGTHNPEVMNIPFWRSMVRSRAWAYAARLQYQDTDSDAEGAVWCFHRFGQSITRLPDGRIIEIAGEHEDYYDPDFCIYNDVVVYDGQGDFTLYGYPATLFPPTDFHTATWVEGWVYIIGNLGYPNDRVIGQTPVYRLNCTTWAIEPVITTGEAPGWISRHEAVLRGAHIHIRGGKIWTISQEQPTLIHNEAEYVLDIDQGCWYRVG